VTSVADGLEAGLALVRLHVWNGLDSMSELIVWTYDWVPEAPRGFVRDIRLRWACEEAGFGYSVRTVPFNDRGPTIWRVNLSVRSRS
jgi:hypothetical protein